MARSVDRCTRKHQCEECLVLDARDLLRSRDTQFDANIDLSWMGDGWICGATACMQRKVTNEVPHIVLCYGIQPHTFRTVNPKTSAPFDNAVSYSIELDSTPQKLCEKRHWFLCPLVTNGCACRRRVRVLYLPQGAQYFGCRHCHNLIYRSSQEQRTKAETWRNSLNLPVEELLNLFCRTHDLGKQKELQLLRRFNELRGTQE